MDDIIDGVVADFQSDLEQAIDQFSEEAKELEDQGLSYEQILAALGVLSIADYILQDLRMQGAINRYMAGIDAIFQGKALFGQMTQAEVLALRNMFNSSISNYIISLGDEIRYTVASGIGRGLALPEIKSLVKRNLSLLPSATERHITTTMATFSRAITASMLQTSPNTRLVFVNPLDDKTRPICKAMVAAGSMTAEEIERRFPGALVDGGGINCRGSWEAVPVNSQEQSKAQGLVDKFKKPPITIKQYYETRNRS